jgi:hypothetical protein
MDQPGDDFLASPAFPGDEDFGLGPCGITDFLLDRTYCRAYTDQLDRRDHR